MEDAAGEALDDGTEVTVGGEQAGEPQNIEAFWATVTSHGTVDAVTGEHIYGVTDAQGVTHHVARSKLRVRKRHTHCFVGVTGDRHHDSHAMQAFTKIELDWLEEERDGSSMVMKHKLRGLFHHSDNAGESHKRESVCVLGGSSMDTDTVGHCDAPAADLQPSTSSRRSPSNGSPCSSVNT